ncbi:hypothetical protein GCM10020256_06240 [Streptomyces thermocoprophilus]
MTAHDVSSPIQRPAGGTLPHPACEGAAVPLPDVSPLSRFRRLPRGRLSRRLPVRQLLCLLPLLLVTVVAVRHRSVLAEGLAQLRDAEWPWLAAAAGTTCLTWVAAACTRQGAVVERLPRRRLLAVQFAAGAANHLLPTGLGASAVNLRFLTVCGLPLARSSAALALYLLAEGVGRLAMLATLLALFPGALRLGALLPEGVLGPLLFAVAAVAATATTALVVVRRLRTAVSRFLRTALGEARAVHARPARALALWGGALAFPALQAGALVLVGRALGLGVPGRAPGGGVSGGDGRGGAGAQSGRAGFGGGGAGGRARRGGRPGGGGDGGRAGVPDHHGVAAAGAGRADAGGAGADEGDLTG